MLEVLLALYLLTPPLTPQEIVTELALNAGQDPAFCTCIVQRESSWDIAAIGDGGKAVGLWQWHIKSWQFVRRKMGLPGTDLRMDAWESTRTALWALDHGYENWWSTAPRCRLELGN